MEGGMALITVENHSYLRESQEKLVGRGLKKVLENLTGNILEICLD